MRSTTAKARLVLGLNNLEDHPFALPVRVEQLWKEYGLSANVPLTGAIFAPIGKNADRNILRDAVSAFVDRHEALRTQIQVISDRPVQVVLPASRPELEFARVAKTDVDGYRLGGKVSALTEFARQPLDLLTDGCGFRCKAFIDEHGDTTIGFLIHHFFGDAWSGQLFRNELSSIYSARRQSEKAMLAAPQQYRDYALSQRRRLDRQLDSQLNFWQRYLSDFPVSRLPNDVNRNSNEMGQALFCISTETVSTLCSLSAAWRVSPQMVYFAAFHLALGRWSDQRDLVVGLNLADRMRVGNQSTIGFLLNLIPIVSRIDLQMPFKMYLQAITKDVRDGYGHQDLSAELYEAIFQPKRPFCMPRFNYLPLEEHFTANMARGIDAFEGVFVAPNMPRILHFRDVHFNVVEYPHTLIGRFIYDADKFSLGNVKKFIRHYELVLDGISKHPESLLREIML